MIPELNDDYYHDPLKKAASDIYSLFIIGALIGWMTIPFGSVAAIFYYQKTPKNHFLRSHFKFQIYCFVWLLAILVLWTSLAYHFWLSPHAAINQSHTPLANSHRVEMAAGFIFAFIVFYILWFRRIWRANWLLSQSVEIKNPLTSYLPKKKE